MERGRIAAFALATVIVFVQAVSAQTPDPVAEAPFRIGALGLAPRLILGNLGLDSNVFNEPADPQRDFVIDLLPTTDAWLRVGRGLFSFRGGLHLAYYHASADERSAGASGHLRYDHRLGKLSPFVSAGVSSVRQRPSLEIDTRARVVDTTVAAGTRVHLTPTTSLDATLARASHDFANAATFRGESLDQALTRTEATAHLSARRQFGPLTTAVVQASTSRERFASISRGDTDSLRVAVGIERGRFAPLRGHVFVGFRRTVPRTSGAMPTFSGATADVDLTYAAPTRTRLQLELDRDVEYSWERMAPYYVSAGLRATLTQGLTGKFDVELSGRLNRLAYRSLVAAHRRNDDVQDIGLSIGYQQSPELRVGVSVASSRRRSNLPANRYHGTRAGLVARYGF